MNGVVDGPGIGLHELAVDAGRFFRKEHQEVEDHGPNMKCRKAEDHRGPEVD